MKKRRYKIGQRVEFKLITGDIIAGVLDRNGRTNYLGKWINAWWIKKYDGKDFLVPSSDLWRLTFITPEA